ncbi:protein phosphatase 2C-like domain-containing protein 1 [Osmerus eperlanus]|uniref:protein phosphatase 2C-like domain-containing protein 1 n=1 Tax=Osmerus eperlanus TaxID=29151 RepID=UPI002E13DB5D
MPEYRVSTHKGNNPLVHAVAVCEERNTTWKRDMEDVTVYKECFGGKEGTSFFGIFDGFHGQNSATTASRELPLLILDQLSKQDFSLSLEKDQADLLSRFDALFQEDCKPQPGQGPNTLVASEQENETKVEQLNLVFNTAFSKMDRILGLGRSESSRIRWSGCTALVCLIDTEASPHLWQHVGEHGRGIASTVNQTLQEAPCGRILIANCGNVHAVLYKKGRGYRLTEDHSTSNPKERNRIMRKGGSISINKQHGLVEGITRATRGLGHYGDSKLRKSIIPVPHVVSLPIEQSYRLLVLASSGLWEALDVNAVAEIAQTVTEMTQNSSMSKAPQLIKTCEEPSSISDTRGQSRQESLFPDDQVPLNEKNDLEVRIKNSETLQGEEGSEVIRITNTQGEGFSSVFPQESGPSGKEHDVCTLRTLHVDYECLAADICRELVDAAIVSGSRENISVMVILLRRTDTINNYTLNEET